MNVAILDNMDCTAGVAPSQGCQITPPNKLKPLPCRGQCSSVRLALVEGFALAGVQDAVVVHPPKACLPCSNVRLSILKLRQVCDTRPVLRRVQPVHLRDRERMEEGGGRLFSEWMAI